MFSRFRAVMFVFFALIAVPLTLMAQQKSTVPASQLGPAATMKLGRLAPSKPVFFIATRGWMAPDPKSKNKADQLWGEKSLQAFMKQLGDEIHEVIQRKAEKEKDSSVLASALPVLVKVALQHPMAVSLISFTTDVDPEVNLSIVIDTESEATDVRLAMEKLNSVPDVERRGNSL